MLQRVAPVPVTVLTGFLGSGKTTLLNAALRRSDAPRFGVIVNEFGAIGVDHDLVEAAREEVVLLPGGCACCTVRSDLAEALERMATANAPSGAAPLERIVVETTGLADPAPIEHLLLQPGALARRFRLDAMVVTVDACLGAATADAHAVWARQAALADRVVVTKLDLAEPGARAALEARLDTLAPLAPRFAGVDGPCALFDGARSDAVPRARPERTHAAHDDSIASFGLRLRIPVDGEMLAEWLDTVAGAYGGRLLRVKGLVNLAGQARPLVVHAAQHLVARPRFLEAWPSDDHETRLVFITRGLEPLDLLAGYAGAEAPQWI